MTIIQKDIKEFLENLKTLPSNAPSEIPIVLDVNPFYPGVKLPECVFKEDINPSISLMLHLDYENLKVTSDKITVILNFKDNAGDVDHKYKVTIPTKSLLGYIGEFPERFDENVLDFQTGKRSVH